ATPGYPTAQSRRAPPAWPRANDALPAPPPDAAVVPPRRQHLDRGIVLHLLDDRIGVGFTHARQLDQKLGEHLAIGVHALNAHLDQVVEAAGNHVALQNLG